MRPVDPEYLKLAMDRIIEETGWARIFPDQCLERIVLIAEAVKSQKPLPFVHNAPSSST